MIPPPCGHGVVVLAVGEEYDTRHRVPVPAPVEHPGRHPEALGDVFAAARDEGLEAALGQALPGLRHAQEPGHAQRVGREGHDAEAVARAQVVDDEPHGLFQQRELLSAHAAAHVEHRHEVERCALACVAVGYQPGSLDVDEGGEVFV
jgi:hypothetical protein